MPSEEQYPAALSGAQLNDFIEQGFVRIDNAFSAELAEQARAIMWRDLRCSEHDPASWTLPVIRLPGYGGEPFRTIANMPILHAAFDQLVGHGRWLPRDGLGTFPVRFPHPMIRATPAGMSISASPATIAIRTRKGTSQPGA